jgi:thiol-disulfide isomerase/thioredoxin
MLPLGTTAPEFELYDTVSGLNKSLSALKSGRATVIIFTCNHCPYVLHINKGLVAVAKKYQPRGVSFIAISSNNVETHPDDAPDKMTIQARKVGYTFPYLYDETQEVAKAYDAACTPDIYVFDGDMRLFYRGRFDASRPKNDIPVTGSDLKAALDAVLKGKPAPEKQYPSGGCNIKWKMST